MKYCWKNVYVEITVRYANETGWLKKEGKFVSYTKKDNPVENPPTPSSMKAMFHLIEMQRQLMEFEQEARLEKTELAKQRRQYKWN